MQVILTSHIKNFGNIGDVVTLKNGYARFLILQKKAIYYSPANYKFFETKRKEFELQNSHNIEIANKIKERIAGKDVIIIENISDDGRLYGSVNSSVVAIKINDILGEKLISRSNILLKKAIKEGGVHSVTLNLYSSISVDLRLIVARSESEVEELVNKSLNENIKEGTKEKEATATS